MNRYFKRHKGKLFCWMLAEFLYALSMVYWSYFMKGLSDTAFGGKGLEGIWNLLLFGCSFLVFYLMVDYGCGICRARFLQACNESLKTDLFDRIIHYNINAFHDSNSAKYISILNNDVKLVDEKYFRVVPRIFSEIIMLTVALIAMFLYNPWIALVCMVLSLLQLAAPMLFGDRASGEQRKYMNSLDGLNAEIKDIFTGFEVVKSFGVENKVIAKYEKIVAEVENNGFQMRRQQTKAQSLSEVFVYLAGMLQLVFSVFLIVRGDISMGVLMGTMQISNYVTNPSHNISELFLEYKTMKSVIQRVLSVLDGETEEDTGTDVEEKGGILEDALPIAVRQMSFSYEKDRTVLDGLNLQFEKGKKYAIVGGSGSGKSTFARLLMGYFDEYEGEISYAGVSLRKLDKESLYRHVAMIHQKVFMFEDTLRNNITMYHDYPEEEVWEAVRNAGLSDVVKRMGNGLDSVILENGRNLSGGEQQRIAIARAFVRRSEVLIMDEGTSSLDNKNAGEIDDLLLEKEGLTLIAITHKTDRQRLERYDEILVLEQGVLLEQGRYQELSAQRKQLLEMGK